MKILTNQDIKQVSLQVLSEIDSICRENKIEYSLAYGSLLGAIRHSGFIPWDDDIDIFMRRADYEHFLKVACDKNRTFELKSIHTDDKYYYLFAKASSLDTKVVEENSNRFNCQLGVSIDIFPIDGLGNTEDEAKTHLKKHRFNRNIIVATNWKKFFRSKTRSVLVEPFRFMFFLISRLGKHRKLLSTIEDYYSSIDINKSLFCGNSVDNNYGDREILLSEVVSEYEDVEFEGRRYRKIKHHDEYLKTIYGDYMQLPPKEKRVTHHSFKAYWKYSN